MTTSMQHPSTDPATDSAPGGARVGLRLQLADAASRDAVDGSWWPQSRDLAVELPDLVDHLPQGFGQVTRAVFSRPDWDTTPHRVQLARRLLKVGSYPRGDSHQLWLLTSTRQLIRLSVRAPEGTAASDSADRGESGTDSRDYWTDDGGSWWDPELAAPSHR